MDLVSSDGDELRESGSHRAAIKEWGDVLSKLPRVDALFVPTGDPGDAPPSELMAMLAAQAEAIEANPSRSPNLDLDAEFHAAPVRRDAENS